MLVTDMWNNYVMVDAYNLKKINYYMTLIYAGDGIGVSVNGDKGSFNDYGILKPYGEVVAEVRIGLFYKGVVK